MSAQPQVTATCGYTAEEQQLLLNVARQAIAAAVERREFSPPTPPARLAEPRAVFTTLHLGSALRGCVGHVVATEPLLHAVAQTAVSAALCDPRFPPLTRAELSGLKIHLSILSPLEPIRVDQIELGRHGLVVAMGARRGLLLPQVPLEWGWTVEEFLAQTCGKAGLPSGAWRDGSTQLFGFTAEVFGDEAQA